MTITSWTPEDLEWLSEWLAHRKSYIPTADEMPKLGWVAWKDTAVAPVPIACAFLRMVEGGSAQLDGLATNPVLPGDIRHVAIDAVVQKALTTAKELGINHVYSFSVDNGTLERSLKHGFVRMPHALIVYNPTGSS